MELTALYRSLAFSQLFASDFASICLVKDEKQRRQMIPSPQAPNHQKKPSELSSVKKKLLKCVSQLLFHYNEKVMVASFFHIKVTIKSLPSLLNIVHYLVTNPFSSKIFLPFLNLEAINLRTLLVDWSRVSDDW